MHIRNPAPSALLLSWESILNIEPQRSKLPEVASAAKPQQVETVQSKNADTNPGSNSQMAL